VHVTHFNKLLWDNGRAPATVIEHGIVDPGYRYTGDLPHAAVVTNEPVRRWRVTGTDLLPAFSAAAPLDVFGMGLSGLAERVGLGPDRLTAVGDLGQDALHTELARRRVYVHTTRWTSLGLSLLEAMHLGMPTVAVASTAAPSAAPPDAGVVSADTAVLVDAVRRFVADPVLATEFGKRARKYALENFALSTFLRSWDVLLTESINDEGG
ncbi:MAG TPA: glycosyltransferase, partial [Actinophytocola sp.]|nr:glycosyltransferase [Actinophytocola sp.]